MKQQINDTDDLRPEYTPNDLRQGVRGKYVKQHQSGTNQVLLAPDVAAAFPTEKAVNEALRSLIKGGSSYVHMRRQTVAKSIILR